MRRRSMSHCSAWMLRPKRPPVSTDGFFVHGCALHRRKFLLQRHLATMRLGDDVSHQRVG